MNDEEIIKELDWMLTEVIVDVNHFDLVDTMNPTLYAMKRIAWYLDHVDDDEFPTHFTTEVINNLTIRFPNELVKIEDWEERIDVFAKDLVDHVIVKAWNDLCDDEDICGSQIETLFFKYLDNLYFGIERNYG